MTAFFDIFSLVSRAFADVDGVGFFNGFKNENDRTFIPI